MKLFLTIMLGLFLAGCASNKEYYSMQEVLIKEVMALKAKEMDLELQREKTRTQLAQTIGPKLDASGAAAVGVMAALPDIGKGQKPAASEELIKMVALQRPPESWDDKALKWAGVLLGGYKIFVDKELGVANINANKDITTALYGMIETINGQTANAGNRGPTNQYTYQTTIENSNGVGVHGGTGTYTGPMTLTCSSSPGPAGNGASSGQGPTSGPGGNGGQAASAPVTCTVTR